MTIIQHLNILFFSSLLKTSRVLWKENSYIDTSHSFFHQDLCFKNPVLDPSFHPDQHQKLARSNSGPGPVLHPGFMEVCSTFVWVIGTKKQAKTIN